jgi:hypothetical protein
VILELPQKTSRRFPRDRMTTEDQAYYRVFSGNRNVGSFLTGAPPASARSGGGWTFPATC